MSAKSPTTSTVLWLLERSPLRLLPGPRQSHRHARDYVAGGGPLLIGDGILRDHAVAGIEADFYALCGQPVTRLGGGGEFTCRACRRIIRRARRDGE